MYTTKLSKILKKYLKEGEEELLSFRPPSVLIRELPNELLFKIFVQLNDFHLRQLEKDFRHIIHDNYFIQLRCCQKYREIKNHVDKPLYLPLQFWFNDDVDVLIPLPALQYGPYINNGPYINIQFADLNNLVIRQT